MDKQEFKRQLEQVAEIKVPKPKTSPGIRLDETHQNDVRVGDEWILVNKEQNDTLPFEFIKAKDRIASCELGCGDIVTNQVIEKRYCQSPVGHWRTRCGNCQCFVSPDGLGFIEGGHAVQAAYIKFFREKGIVDKAEPRVIEQGDSKTTHYARSKPGKWQDDGKGNLIYRE